MTKQIHDVAAKALSDLKANGINKGGRSWFNSFKDAKALTQQWALEVRAAVREQNELNEANTMEISGAFRFVTVSPESLTFRGWTDLRCWLEEAELTLNNLIEQHKPKADEWVYFSCNLSTGWHYAKRRYKVGSAEGDCTEALCNGIWQKSALTVDLVFAMMADGEAYEDGEPVAPKSKSQATDPETGISYWVDERGDVLSRRSNDVSWCSAPCTVRVVKVLIKLGLVEA